ncbi:MAG TPA: PAS domain S-box protein [Tepidisphaeraceae bacterium]|nr:PAS domain S-box protein [Tepidisphaeraceae bacterium]
MTVSPFNSPTWPRPEHSKRSGYIVSIASIAVATGLGEILKIWLGDQVTIIFFVAVMLSAWYGGLGPALLATFLGTIASTVGFPNPGWVGWDDPLRAIVFLIAALLICSLTSLRRNAENNLRRTLDELEVRVQERTAELRASNDKVRESEERFRLLVEGVSDYAIIMLDPVGDVVSWNSGAQRTLGWEQDEILGRPFCLFFPEGMDAQGQCARQLQQAGAVGRHEDEGWRVRKDGSRFWAEVFTTPVRSESGELRWFAQVMRDVSLLRELERQILDISENEQRRIGHDLHDGLGQELTGLAFFSQNLAARLTAAERSEAVEANRLASLAARAVEQTRELAHGFSPVELGPEGLRMALNALAERISEMSPMQCRFEFTADALVNNDAAALQLYRIAQEALNNAVRHSQGKSLLVSLSRQGSDIILRVRDDGIGLPSTPATTARQGMGINLMRYRARTIRAILDVNPAKPCGTEVVCTWPGETRAEGNLSNGKDTDHREERQIAVSHSAGG